MSIRRWDPDDQPSLAGCKIIEDVPEEKGRHTCKAVFGPRFNEVELPEKIVAGSVTGRWTSQEHYSARCAEIDLSETEKRIVAQLAMDLPVEYFNHIPVDAKAVVPEGLHREINSVQFWGMDAELGEIVKWDNRYWEIVNHDAMKVWREVAADNPIGVPIVDTGLLVEHYTTDGPDLGSPVCGYDWEGERSDDDRLGEMEDIIVEQLMSKITLAAKNAIEVGLEPEDIEVYNPILIGKKDSTVLCDIVIPNSKNS